MLSALRQDQSAPPARKAPPDTQVNTRTAAGGWHRQQGDACSRQAASCLFSPPQGPSQDSGMDPKLQSIAPHPVCLPLSSGGCWVRRHWVETSLTIPLVTRPATPTYEPSDSAPPLAAPDASHEPQGLSPKSAQQGRGSAARSQDLSGGLLCRETPKDRYLNATMINTVGIALVFFFCLPVAMSSVCPPQNSCVGALNSGTLESNLMCGDPVIPEEK